MKKKQYISPLVEALPWESIGSIMKTSIGMEGSNMPTEPGAPQRRWTDVF